MIKLMSSRAGIKRPLLGRPGDSLRLLRENLRRAVQRHGCPRVSSSRPTTHIPDFARTLPPALLRAASRADLILHAGDVSTVEVLETLSTYAPVRVALGNNDRDDVAAFGAAPEGLAHHRRRRRKLGSRRRSSPGPRGPPGAAVPTCRPRGVRTLPHPDGHGARRPTFLEPRQFDVEEAPASSDVRDRHGRRATVAGPDRRTVITPHKS